MEGVGTGRGVSLRPNPQPMRPGSGGRHCGPADHQLQRESAHEKGFNLLQGVNKNEYSH